MTKAIKLSNEFCYYTKNLHYGVLKNNVHMCSVYKLDEVIRWYLFIFL